MAKFLFRLQGNLNLKEKLEHQKKMEFGRAIAQLESEKAYKQSLESEKSEYLDIFRKSVLKGINPLDIQSYNTYIDLLKKKVIEQDKVIIVAQKNVDKKRLELSEAVKERKKIEKMRENAFEQYVEEEKIAEQKIVDEIVSYQYN